MASDKNKNNELVAEQDDDPTAELEILAEAAVDGEDASKQAESESDANTFDFDNLESDDDGVDETITSLKSDLKLRNKRISKLQFDVEQLRSKWFGLEKELKVREEVTCNLTHDLKAAHKKLSDTEKLLGQRDKEVESLRSQIRNHEQSLLEFDKVKMLLDTAEQRLAELHAESELDKSEKQSLLGQAQSLRSEVDDIRRELESSRATVAELQQYVDSRKADWHNQEEQPRANEKRVRELGNASGRIATDDTLRTGMLAGKNFEINELKSQIVRTETYADKLRRQLQDQLNVTDGLQTRQRHLEVSLTSANSKLHELADTVEELRSVNAELTDQKTRLREEFEAEVRQLRFELGEAQAAIADRESLNQQLTSNLVDTRETKMNLESQLSANEEETKAKIGELKRKVLQLETLNQELNEKLSSKDHAITALLNELAKRSETIESIDEMEDVIHDLDDRMSERIDDSGDIERERITRLLIGKIDGQKLRFPLFKNRLTIGRTGHNDIQLKAPYISRRHAVIVTDNDCTRIVDWGSKNGVYVNKYRVKEQVLHNGDVVTIGTADFKFEERPKR